MSLHFSFHRFRGQPIVVNFCYHLKRGWTFKLLAKVVFRETHTRQTPVGSPGTRGARSGLCNIHSSVYFQLRGQRRREAVAQATDTPGNRGPSGRGGRGFGAPSRVRGGARRPRQERGPSPPAGRRLSALASPPTPGEGPAGPRGGRRAAAPLAPRLPRGLAPRPIWRAGSC